jgi:hypothetical protein
MVLFWSHIFATGNSKIDNPPEMVGQILTFRGHALDTFPNILTELAKNSAMIFWLDNNVNHKGAIYENGAGSCWNCSQWAWVTTLRMTSRKYRSADFRHLFFLMKVEQLTTSLVRSR